MALKLMYITNIPEVAAVAEKNGVDRIWVDLETLGKEERQKGMNTVKSQHTMEDVSRIRDTITKSQLLVRINPLHDGTKREVDEVVARGADIIMLPMFETALEAGRFVDIVNGRTKVLLLAETKEAEKNMEEIVQVPGVDEIHIGLNDLHIQHHMKFMFELLADGTVEKLCNIIKEAKIPYGFGGIASLNGGQLPGSHVVAEHYRLGSSMAILSRSFCDVTGKSMEEVENVFRTGISELRNYEEELRHKKDAFFIANKEVVCEEVEKIVRGRNDGI